MPARFKLIFAGLIILLLATIATVEVWTFIDTRSTQEDKSAPQQLSAPISMEEAASRCSNSSGGTLHSGGAPMLTVCFSHDLSTGERRNFDAMKIELDRHRKEFGAAWHDELSAAVTFSCQMSNPVAYDVARSHYAQYWRADGAQKWPEVFMVAHDEHCVSMRPAKSS